MSAREGSVYVRILRQTLTYHPDTNEPVEGFVMWREAYATLNPMRGGEFNSANQVYSEVMTRFTFDFMEVEGILPTDRIETEDGDQFDIRAIRKDRGRNRFIIVDAVEGNEPKVTVP